MMKLFSQLSRFSGRSLLLLLIGLVLVLTIIINISLKGARLDLTADRQYTLSTGTRNILKDLENPVTLQFYFSDELTKDIPQLRSYAKRVQELLGEYELASRGKIILEIIDPEPFSENEDKAAELGLQRVPIAAGGPEIFFGLAGSNTAGGKNIIEFFHSNKEESLEYDLSQLVYKTGKTKANKLGLVTAMDIRGGYNPMTRQPTPAWVAWMQLEQSIETINLGTEFDTVDPSVQTLLIIHPKELSDKTIYAIDQFALDGGNILVFVDPHAETEMQMPIPGMEMPVDSNSNLEKLFSAWGLELVAGKALADARHAIQVNFGPDRQVARHLGIQNFNKGNFNASDSIIKSLENINIASSGVLKPLSNSSTTFTPIIQSSTSSMLIDVERLKYMTDPNSLFEGFTPDGETHVIAARISGKINSAFPKGLAIDNTSDKTAKKSPAKTETTKPDHLQESTSDVNILVFADTDILSDRLWVRIQNFFGQQMASPFADNGTLLFNAVDQMMGSGDLISIRSRGRHQRPFDKVNDLQRQAESNYRNTEEELKSRLNAAETRLRELQANKQGQGQDQLSLSVEQQQEIEKFQQEKLRIRKNLREVQHQLGEDIERLGTRLKLINIALIPALLTVFVLGFNFYQTSKKRQTKLA